jgi:tight adherence protein B
MTASTIALVAGVGAGSAAYLMIGGVRRPRLQAPSSGPGPTGTPVIALAAGIAAAVVFLHGTQVVLALLALAVAAAAAHDVRRRKRLAATGRRADQVLVVCEGLASDLRAGQPPVTALTAAAEDWPEIEPAAAAARFGADVPAALRTLAERPGAGQLRTVAAAWQVAHRSGAGLAETLEMAARRLRDDRATARVVATELAAAHATARLLTALPVGVLLLGSGLGGDPIGFLVGTPAGLVCLCLGLGLAYAGLSWLTHIGDRITG